LKTPLPLDNLQGEGLLFLASSSYFFVCIWMGEKKELTQKVSDLIWAILFSIFFPGSLIKIVSPLGSDAGVLIFLG